jgi:large subunit ribosomal protein L30
MSQLKITQVRSTVGTRWKQRESLRTLGLRRIRHSVIRDDSPQTRGLIAVVRHLVEVEPAETGTGGNAK